MAARGILYIVSAPSGTGKTTLVTRLANQDPNIRVSVSHTTRAPRVGEKEGKDYYFVELPNFKQLEQEGHFLETAHVFGNWYGTSKGAIEEQLAMGLDVILEIDWQGARHIKAHYPCISIFILPPAKAALLTRLKSRAQDDDAVITQRMNRAVDEMSHYNEYDYIVVNDNFETALGDLLAIIRAGRHSIALQSEQFATLMRELMT